MKKHKSKKFIREGRYAAEINVELIETDDYWSPYLSLEDALKIDDVREALSTGDVDTAKKLAYIFELVPVG
jgi:hypothetical protein